MLQPLWTRDLHDQQARCFDPGGRRRFFSTSVVSKRGRFPSISYFVQDVTDVDGSFRQPTQCHEALIFLAVDIPGGVFPAARGSDSTDQLKVGRFNQCGHDFFALSPTSRRIGFLFRYRRALPETLLAL
jgi:hypothetical protein